MLRNRHPAGTPVGGQFTTTARGEASVTLGSPAVDPDRVGLETGTPEPEPESFWTSVRKSLRFGGATPTAWHG